MEIRIYLENYQIDTDENSIIAMTMCYSYLEDPTTVAGDYSKTIKIPGTVNNNKIFGQIWNLDRTVLFGDSNTSVYFNPSKKTEAKIYIGPEIFKVGYVQLNNIIKDKNVITYEITFYSELCNVLHNLLDSSLCNLNFPNNGLKHIISADNIYNINTSNHNSLRNHLKYGLTIDGLYENFSSDKWLTKDSSDNLVVAPIDNNGTKYDTAMLLQAYSAKVRPMVYVSSLLEQIKEDYNRDSSTQLVYDDEYFFNGSNPYCVNSVLTCKTYDTDNASTVNVNLTANNFKGNLGANGGRVKLVLNDNNSGFADEDGNLDLSSISSPKELKFEFMLRIAGTLNQSQWQSATSSYSSNFSGRRFVSNGTTLSIKVILVDANTDKDVFTLYSTNNPWYTDDIPLYDRYDNDYYPVTVSPLIFERNANSATFELAFKNSFVTGSLNEYVSDPVTGESSWVEVPQFNRIYSNLETSGTLNVLGMDSYYNDNIGVTDYFPFVFSSNALTGNITGKYKVYVELTSNNNKLKCANKGNTDTEIDITGWEIFGRCNNAGVTDSNGNSIYIYRNTQSFQDFSASTHYNCPVVSTSGHNCSLSGSTGISSGSNVSFKDMVDSDVTQGDFLINYSKIFGLIYDTDSVAFDNTIRLKTRNSYHKNYKILDWTDKIDYSKPFRQTPLTFKTKYLSLAYNPMDSYYEKRYRKTYDDDYGIQKIDTGYDFNDNTTQLLTNQLFKQTVMVKGEALLNGGAVPAYFDKANNERSPIDAQYSLLFWNQDSSLNNYSPNIQIIDDVLDMHDSSVGGSDETCWIDTKKVGQYRNLNLTAPSTLRSQEIQIGGKTITQTFSWDLGYPQSNYAKWSTNTYPSSATIYSNYWKSYISDLYNVNTRILKCYVYLTPIDILKFSFKDFVKIGDTLWHPNQIIDYNPLSDNPVQVELIKVNDITAYTDSQTKWYDYIDVTFTVVSTDVPEASQKEIISPVSGGVISSTSGKSNYIGKFLRGKGFSQSFTYVGNYDSINTVTARYYDTISGQNIDCTSWFNIDTLTFTVPENTVTGPITVNIDVKSGTPFYNVICEDNVENNVKYTAVIPSGSIPSRIAEGSELKIRVSGNGSSDKFILTSKSVTMGGTDITSTAFDELNSYVHIQSVTGDVILNFAYIDTSDILLPYFMNSSDDFASNYNVKKGVYFDTGVTPTTYKTSLEAITASNNDYTTTSDKAASYDTYSSPIMGITYGSTTQYEKAYFGLVLYNACVANTAAFTMCFGDKVISSESTKYAEYPHGESASYPIRILKCGANKYDSQYFFDNKNYQGDSAYSFFQINDQIKIYTYFGSSISSSNLTQIYLFGSKHSLTSSRYAAYALTKIYAARIFDNNICKGDYHPVLHWENGTYVPRFYDSISKTYLKNLSSADVYYMLDSHEDIYISWIGNGTGDGIGDTWFDLTGINSEQKVGIQVVSSMDSHPSGNSAIFSFNSKANQGNNVDARMLYFDIDSGVFKLAWGLNNNNEQIYVNTSAPSFKTLMTTTCYTAPESKKVRCILNGGLYESSEVESQRCSETLKLFKTRDSNSYKGIKIYEVRAFTRTSDEIPFSSSTNKPILDNTKGTQTTEYLRPVLHYTGTTNTFTTKEGFNVPKGYEPCFLDVISGKYYYMSSNSTNPTISCGFYE